MCQPLANSLHSKGAGQFGLPGPQSSGARINTIEDAQKVIDEFTSHGYRQIDTSRIYGGGTSEEVRAGSPSRLPSSLINAIADNQPTRSEGMYGGYKVCIFAITHLRGLSYLPPCVGSTQMRLGTFCRTEFGSRLKLP
jgi:hypothetical protein